VTDQGFELGTMEYCRCASMQAIGVYGGATEHQSWTHRSCQEKGAFEKWFCLSLYWCRAR